MFCSWSHWNRYVWREIQEIQITWQSHDTSHDSHVMCGGLTLVCSFLSCLWHSQIPSGPTPNHRGMSFLSWNGQLIIGADNQSWSWYTKNCCMCVRTCILYIIKQNVHVHTVYDFLQLRRTLTSKKCMEYMGSDCMMSRYLKTASPRERPFIIR